MKISRILPLVARLALGGLLVFSGANKLVPFMTVPPMAAPGMAFLGALAATGYMLPLIGAVEVLFGGLLLAGWFVPLALTVLAPILINILLFHTMLVPGPAVALTLIACELYLAWRYRDAFRGVLQARPPIAAD